MHTTPQHLRLIEQLPTRNIAATSVCMDLYVYNIYICMCVRVHRSLILFNSLIITLITSVYVCMHIFFKFHRFFS